MRRSNCSAPISARGSLGFRGKMCVIKKGGALEKRWLKWFIRVGQGRNKVIKRPGQPQKKWCPWGSLGGNGGRTIWPADNHVEERDSLALEHTLDTTYQIINHQSLTIVLSKQIFQSNRKTSFYVSSHEAELNSLNKYIQSVDWIVFSCSFSTRKLSPYNSLLNIRTNTEGPVEVPASALRHVRV